MKTIFARIAATAALALAPVSAQAAQLVTNGGFETNNFAGWTPFGNTANTFTVQAFGSEAPHGGLYQAALGAPMNEGGITQTLNTVAGQTYTVSFWVANLQLGITNSFKATFGDVPLLVLVDSPAFSYRQVSLTMLATSSQTALTFTARHDPSFFVLDDVSVEGPAGAVPEPATWAMMLLGFIIVGTALRARGTQNLAADA